MSILSVSRYIVHGVIVIDHLCLLKHKEAFAGFVGIASHHVPW